MLVLAAPEEHCLQSWLDLYAKARRRLVVDKPPPLVKREPWHHSVVVPREISSFVPAVAQEPALSQT
jgi:hypothetical protein